MIQLHIAIAMADVDQSTRYCGSLRVSSSARGSFSVRIPGTLGVQAGHPAQRRRLYGATASVTATAGVTECT